MVKIKELRIGTRGSQLALWQANWVKSQIEERYPGIRVSLVKIKTSGDKILDVPLAKVGGKGLFVKEIEEALLRKDIDMAVHSMKDVPVDLPKGLHLRAITKREDPRDALIISQKSEVRSQKSNPPLPPFSKGGRGGINSSLLFSFPHGATVGTSSLRRSCQLLSIRPDLNITQLRGNLDTRIKKLDRGDFDAIVVAAAGVKRMGWEDRISEYLPISISLPAIGQGALGIECRINDKDTNELLEHFNNPETNLSVRAERAFLRRLEGGCQVPIAGHAIIKDGSLFLEGLVGSVDGKRLIRDRLVGKTQEAEEMGYRLAEILLSKGADSILAEVYGRTFKNR